MLKHFYRLMVVALGSLLALSCNNGDRNADEQVDADNEYGASYAIYHVAGKVLSDDGAPIQGIKITVKTCYNTFEGKSNEQGEFNINYNGPNFSDTGNGV